jgi:hypothetical protein
MNFVEKVASPAQQYWHTLASLVGLLDQFLEISLKKSQVQDAQLPRISCYFLQQIPIQILNQFFLFKNGDDIIG